MRTINAIIDFSAEQLQCADVIVENICDDYICFVLEDCYTPLRIGWEVEFAFHADTVERGDVALFNKFVEEARYQAKEFDVDFDARDTEAYLDCSDLPSNWTLEELRRDSEYKKQKLTELAKEANKKKKTWMAEIAERCKN